jgi:hypothetical protein
LYFWCFFQTEMVKSKPCIDYFFDPMDVVKLILANPDAITEPVIDSVSTRDQYLGKSFTDYSRTPHSLENRIRWIVQNSQNPFQEYLLDDMLKLHGWKIDKYKYFRPDDVGKKNALDRAKVVEYILDPKSFNFGASSSHSSAQNNKKQEAPNKETKANNVSDSKSSNVEVDPKTPISKKRKEIESTSGSTNEKGGTQTVAEQAEPLTTSVRVSSRRLSHDKSTPNSDNLSWDLSKAISPKSYPAKSVERKIIELLHNADVKDLHDTLGLKADAILLFKRLGWRYLHVDAVEYCLVPPWTVEHLKIECRQVCHICGSNLEENVDYFPKVELAFHYVLMYGFQRSKPWESTTPATKKKHSVRVESQPERQDDDDDDDDKHEMSPITKESTQPVLKENAMTPRKRGRPLKRPLVARNSGSALQQEEQPLGNANNGVHPVDTDHVITDEAATTAVNSLLELGTEAKVIVRCFKNDPEILDLLQSPGIIGKAQRLLTILEQRFYWKRQRCTPAFRAHFGIETETIILHPEAALSYEDTEEMHKLEPDCDFFTSEKTLLQYFDDLYGPLLSGDEAKIISPGVCSNKERISQEVATNSSNIDAISQTSSLPTVPKNSKAVIQEERSSPFPHQAEIQSPTPILSSPSLSAQECHLRTLLESIEIPETHYQAFKAATLQDGLNIDSLEISRSAMTKKNIILILNALMRSFGWMTKVLAGRLLYFKSQVEGARCQSIHDIQLLLFRSVFTSRDQIMQYIEVKLEKEEVQSPSPAKREHQQSSAGESAQTTKPIVAIDTNTSSAATPNKLLLGSPSRSSIKHQLDIVSNETSDAKKPRLQAEEDLNMNNTLAANDSTSMMALSGLVDYSSDFSADD